MTRWMLLALAVAVSSLTGCVTLDTLDGDGAYICEYRREAPRPELEEPVFAEASK